MYDIRFGANGWRARIDDGFTEENVVRIADALGRTWAPRNEGYTVLVGYDTRRDSKRLAVVVGQVLAAHGMRAVVSDRVCPTPALSWAVAQDPLCIAGVMLTASRMPHEYGGILVRQDDGGPMSSMFASSVDQAIAAEPTDLRGEVTYDDFVTPYLKAIEEQADCSLIASAGLRVVVDPMYGAGCGYIAELFKRMGCDVIEVHGTPHSDFRGLHPDVHEPWVDDCERAVIEHKASLGFAFDGDCDRFGVIDDAGRLVSPHDLAPLVLEHLVRQRGLRGRVVATQATSARIARQAERFDLDFTMVPRGSESIYREYAEGDVLLATDESGCISVPAFAYQRDGILGAAMLLELIAGSSDSVRDLVRQCEDEIGNMEYAVGKVNLDFGAAQRLRNLLPGMNPPEVLGEEPVSVSHAGGLRLELPDGAWVFLTPSTAGARMAAEAPTASRARELIGFASSLVDS